MNYMWEVMLESAAIGLEKDDIKFFPSKTANPYREVFFSDVNRTDFNGEPVETNAFYHYSAIFGKLLGEDMKDCEDLQLQLFDVLAHYLSELDLHQGLCRSVYYAGFLREDIANGFYGAKNAKSLECFSSAQRRIFLAELLRMYRTGTSMRLFAKLLRELYPDSITYLDIYKDRELLIYVGKKKTKALEAQLDLLCDLFVPIDYDVKLFWDMHFGLIETLETMRIGNIMMY